MGVTLAIPSGDANNTQNGNCSELKGSGFFAKLGTDLQRRNQSGPANQSLEEPEIRC